MVLIVISNGRNTVTTTLVCHMYQPTILTGASDKYSYVQYCNYYQNMLAE